MYAYTYAYVYIYIQVLYVYVYIYTRTISLSTDAMASLEKEITDLSRSHKVVVFSMDYCPYCKKVIAELQKLKPNDMVQTLGLNSVKEFVFVIIVGLQLFLQHVWHFQDDPRADDIQDVFEKMTGAGTVPRVFIGGKFVGGCDETVCTAFMLVTAALMFILKNQVSSAALG